MPAQLPAREDVDALCTAALPDTTIDLDGAARLLAFLDDLLPAVLPRMAELLRDDLRSWEWRAFRTDDRTTGGWRGELLLWMRTHEADLLRARRPLGRSRPRVRHASARPRRAPGQHGRAARAAQRLGPSGPRSRAHGAALARLSNIPGQDANVTATLRALLA